MTQQHLFISAQNAMSALAGRMALVTSTSSDERGSAMSEYGILIAMVFISALVGLAVFGEAVLELFTAANDEYTNANGNGGGSN